MLSGGIDAAVAQVDNRFAYLCGNCTPSLCPYYLLMLDIAALDFPIQVGKITPRWCSLRPTDCATTCIGGAGFCCKALPLFSDTLSLKALAFRQPLNQSRAKLREAAAQKMGAVTHTASQFL